MKISGRSNAGAATTEARCCCAGAKEEVRKQKKRQQLNKWKKGLGSGLRVHDTTRIHGLDANGT